MVSVLKIISIFLICCCLAISDGSRRVDMFSSVTALEASFIIEKELITILSRFINDVKLNIMFVKLLYKSLSEQPILEAKLLPLIRRIKIHQINTKDVYEKFLVSQNQTPNESDLLGTILSILRLQRTYGYTAEALANGYLSKTVLLQSKLTSHDCFIIGQQLAKLQLHTYAIEWLEAAQTRLNHTEKVLAKAFPHFNESSLFKLISSLRKQESLDADELLGLNFIETLQLACAGKQEKSASEAAKLFCKYERRNHPFLYLAPIKMEILNLSPYLAIFHDIIYESEIEALKKLSQPSMERADVWNEEAGRYTVMHNRISQHSWIYNERKEGSLLQILQQRMQDMTGLSMETTEEIQVANYGAGGHYSLHHDYGIGFDNDEYGKGDRMATIMFYLSDVAAGGATVWPLINVRMYPIKGAAAFWYNLHSDLQGNNFTLHSACPVVLGSKWVANKWVRSEGEMFRRPCLQQSTQT